MTNPLLSVKEKIRKDGYVPYLLLLCLRVGVRDLGGGEGEEELLLLCLRRRWCRERRWEREGDRERECLLLYEGERDKLRPIP